ncbi:MAG TPA: hypothetical protein VK524_26815 [Polyangiaceae bacterium]|nr:hypothetical protein [Polyangiaceae bacterium]
MLGRSDNVGAEFSPLQRRARHFRLAIALFAAASALTASAAALEPTLTLGRVSLAPGYTLALRDALNTALRQELQEAPLAKLRSREGYVLSVRLQKLDTVRKPRWTQATCAVSILLKRKSDQTLLAVVNGRAIAQDTHAAATSTALRAAVHGAMKKVPAAVAQLN